MKCFLNHHQDGRDGAPERDRGDASVWGADTWGEPSRGSVSAQGVERIHDLYPIFSQYRRDCHTDRHHTEPHPGWSSEKVTCFISFLLFFFPPVFKLRSTKILCFVATFQTVTSSILALGLASLSHWCWSFCFWDGFGSPLSMGDWKPGNGLTCIYLYICVLCRYFDNLSCTRCAKCVCCSVLMMLSPKCKTLFLSCIHLCIYSQFLLEEKWRTSPVRGQSKWSNKGGVQKTRAHKVRIRVCL